MTEPVGFFVSPAPTQADVDAGKQIPKRALRQQDAERRRRLREAKRLGAAAVTIDGVRYEFESESSSAPDNALDGWLLKHPEYARATKEH